MRKEKEREKDAPFSGYNLLEHGDHSDLLALCELLARLDRIEREEQAELGYTRDRTGGEVDIDWQTRGRREGEGFSRREVVKDGSSCKGEDVQGRAASSEQHAERRPTGERSASSVLDES